MKTLVRVVFRIFLASVCVGTFFVATQDFHIFPGLIPTLLGVAEPSPPDSAEVVSLTSQDGVKISLWKLEPKGQSRKEVALLFHGNGETLRTFFGVQQWFSSIGIRSYAIEYRGYGNSSGWPSERRLYMDSEVAVQAILERERISPKELIVFGNSIGCGPASYVAERYEVGTLLLVAPYTSLGDVVEELPLFGYLTPFLWYDLPTRDYIVGLTKTCVVAAHGVGDMTIPFKHSQRLKESYRGVATFTLVTSDEAGHNDIFASAQDEIFREMMKCLKREQ
jgi:uncharacterized protein